MTTTEQKPAKKRTTFFHIKAHSTDPDGMPPWISAKFVEWNLKRFGFLNFLAGERAEKNQRVATCFAHIKALCEHLHDLAADSLADESDTPKRYDKRTAPLSQVTVYIQPFVPEGQPDRFRTDIAICADCYKADLQRAEDQVLTDLVWTLLEGERFNVRDSPYPIICRRALQKANPNVHVAKFVVLGKDLLRTVKPDPEDSVARTAFLERLSFLADL